MAPHCLVDAGRLHFWRTRRDDQGSPRGHSRCDRQYERAVGAYPVCLSGHSQATPHRDGCPDGGSLDRHSACQLRPGKGGTGTRRGKPEPRRRPTAGCLGRQSLGSVGCDRGATLGALSSYLATKQQWGLAAIVVACLLFLEPVTRILWAISKGEPPRTLVPSPAIWVGEVLCGCLTLLAFQLRRSASRDRTRSGPPIGAS
jgi:hypothetical protein